MEQATTTTNQGVVLHYAMAEMDEEDREVIDDAIAELDVLLDGHVLIESEVHVGISPEDWVRRNPDRVYQAYEWTLTEDD